MATGTLTMAGFAQGMRAGVGNLVAAGTHAYAPKTRRRLRSVNVGSFTVAVSCLLFALTYAQEDAWLYRGAIAVNLVLMLMSLSVPALHRINENAGALFITIALLAGLFLLVALMGRESGIQINFIGASAAIFLVFELRRIRLIAALIAVAIVLHVASWVLFREGLVQGTPAPRFLLQLYITVVITISVIIAVLVYYAFRTAEQAEAETESLLLRILPAQIAERLKARPDAAIADSFAEASVLFSDIVGFVPISRSLGALRTVAMLNHLFKRFDRLAAEHGVEKIKTIGDAYMAVSGVPHPSPDHAARLARMALRMHTIAEKTGAKFGLPLKIRIGIAEGPVMAGVIGTKRFGYDIWGDTVNLAARLESSGAPQRIHVSRSFRDALADAFSFASRGATEIKGVGDVETFFLVDERLPASAGS